MAASVPESRDRRSDVDALAGRNGAPGRAWLPALTLIVSFAVLAGACTLGSSPDADAPPSPRTTAGLPDTGEWLVGPPAPVEPRTPFDHPSPAAQKILQANLGGIVLGLFSQDPDYDYASLLMEIRETGSPWVSLMINNYQADVSATETGIPDRRTAPLERVRVSIRQARALGMRVLLFPILLLDDPGENDWRGTIRPADAEAWFRSYAELMERYAILAQEESVDLLSIGSEFNSMQGNLAGWQGVIDRVRAAYEGPITYSANWDSLDGVSFIQELDLIGMTTYFGLSDEDDPSVATMVKRWETIRTDIHEWSHFHQIPLIFTEVGFPSQDGANRNPWNYYHSTVVDVAEQRDCYEAFDKVWAGDSALGGVFFYNWFGHGGSEDTGYTPRGKPALEIIRSWFSDLRRRGAESKTERTPQPSAGG